MPKRTGSVDPSDFPDEVFDLYSVPAFDTGQPEILAGSKIGSAKQVVQPGDVLLSKIVPHIRRCWVVGENRGRRIIASGEWIVFRSQAVDPDFLRYSLVEDRFHAKFINTVSGLGGSLVRARPSYVAEIEIALPSPTEQRRITGELERADGLRRTRRYAVELADTFLPAAFIQLFGDLQHGAGDKTELHEVADMITGYPFSSMEYVVSGDTIRLCRGANVLPDRIDWTDLAIWPKSKAENLSDFLLKSGDVVMAMDRPWITEGFKVTQVRPEDCPALLVQRVARLRGKDGVPNEFLYHLLRQPMFTRHCRPTETTIPHISPTEIRSFAFHLPPLPLQTRFAELVQRHERLRAVQRESLRQAEHLFQSLLHRAFTP